MPPSSKQQKQMQISRRLADYHITVHFRLSCLEVTHYEIEEFLKSVETYHTRSRITSRDMHEFP